MATKEEKSIFGSELSITAIVLSNNSCALWVDEGISGGITEYLYAGMTNADYVKYLQSYIELCKSKLTSEEREEFKYLIDAYTDNGEGAFTDDEVALSEEAALKELDAWNRPWREMQEEQVVSGEMFKEGEYGYVFEIPSKMYRYNRRRVNNPDIILHPGDRTATVTKDSCIVEVMYQPGKQDGTGGFVVGLELKELKTGHIITSFSGHKGQYFIVSFKNKNGEYDPPIYNTLLPWTGSEGFECFLEDGKLNGYQRCDCPLHASFYKEYGQMYPYVYAYSDGTPYEFEDYQKYFDILRALQQPPYIVATEIFPELTEYLTHGGDVNRFAAAVAEMELQHKPGMTLEELTEALEAVHTIWAPAVSDEFDDVSDGGFSLDADDEGDTGAAGRSTTGNDADQPKGSEDLGGPKGSDVGSDESKGEDVSGIKRMNLGS